MNVITIVGTSAMVDLTLGQQALIDTEDIAVILPYTWHAFRHGRTFYARTNIRLLNGKKTSIRMHRLLLGAPHGLQVDHRDGNGLNNRRRGQTGNIRVATKLQNAKNRVVSANNKSGFTGVYWHKSSQNWVASITCNKKRIYLGRFDDKEDAAAAYHKASVELFGEFSRSHQITTIGGLFGAQR